MCNVMRLSGPWLDLELGFLSVTMSTRVSSQHGTPVCLLFDKLGNRVDEPPTGILSSWSTLSDRSYVKADILVSHAGGFPISPPGQ